MKNKKMSGIISTVLSAVLFGITPIIAKMAYANGSNAETLVFYRNVFAIPMLYFICRKQKIAIKVDRPQVRQIIFIGTFGIASTTLMLYLSYQYISVGTATTLHFLYPVFVALLCRWIYQEKLTKAKVISLSISMLGILFFLDNIDSDGMIGVILSLTSGITYGYYMVAVEKKGLKQINPFLLSMFFAIVVSIVMFLYNVLFGTMRWNLPIISYVYMLLVSLGTSFIGVVLLQIGITKLGATMAAIFCLFEPIASLIAGVIFLNEEFSFLKIAGSAIILCGVACLVLLDRNANSMKSTNNTIITNNTNNI